MAEPLTPQQAEALLLAKNLMDTGELPGAVYDALAGWACRLLGIQHQYDIQKLMASWRRQHPQQAASATRIILQREASEAT